MGYYSKDSTEALKQMAANLDRSAREPMPEMFRSAYEYDAWRNQQQDTARHLKMIRGELALRERSKQSEAA